MGSLFGSKQPKFIEPKAVEPPAPAVSDLAAPVTEVTSGADSSSSDSIELRKKYRPTKGIGSTGTGLSV